MHALRSGARQEKPVSQPAFDTVALMGNPEDERILEPVRILTAHLSSQGKSVILADSMSATAVPVKARRVPELDLSRQAQLVVAVGGDGSMLYAARRLAGSGVPLLGINRGRLGFLADVGQADMLARIDEILRGDFVTESRMLLRAEIVDGARIVGGGLALNDIVVSRHDPGRMLEIRTFINGRYVNTHGGDGFIIATATGSTAYALSCGGPILAPSLDAIVLVPICPHTLSERPIIVPATAITEVMLSEPHTTRAEVSCDGEVAAELLPGRSLRVRASEQRVALIHPRSYDYFEILRDKLHWGRDHHSVSGRRS
jgi:NAD+ kinase